MSKVEKKKAVAKKMLGGNLDKKQYGREKANGRRSTRPIIEGDEGGTDVYENKFSKKDVKKEKKARHQKAKEDWEN